MRFAGQPQVLKQYNSNLIERLILEKGPISKPELAQLTHLSLPTVNKIVDEFVAAGTVLEDAVQSGSGVGRKAMTYVVNGNSRSILTVHYEDGKWKAVSVNIFGIIIEETETPASNGRKGDALCAIYGLLDGLLERTEHVKAIGIGIPGVVMADGEVLGIPSIPSLEGVNIQVLLQKRYRLPVFVENDVKLMTLGYYTEQMKDLDNIVFFYVGQGIGAGIIINGQLYKGNGSFAGEFGYMTAGGESETLSPAKNTGGSLENRLMLLRTEFLAHPEDAKCRRAFYKLIGQVLINCAAVVNPEAIVLFGKELDEEAVCFLKEELGKFLPVHCVPDICLTQDCGYESRGLIRLCLDGAASKCWLLEAVENR